MDGNEISLGTRRPSPLPRTLPRASRVQGAQSLSGRGTTSLLTPMVRSKIHVDSFLPISGGSSTSQIPVGRIQGSARGLEKCPRIGDAITSRIGVPPSESANGLSRAEPPNEDRRARTLTGERKVSSITVRLSVSSAGMTSASNKNHSASESGSHKERRDALSFGHSTELKMIPKSTAVATSPAVTRSSNLPKFPALTRASQVRGNEVVMRPNTPASDRRPFYPRLRGSTRPQITHSNHPLSAQSVQAPTATLDHIKCGVNAHCGQDCDPEMATQDWRSASKMPVGSDEKGARTGGSIKAASDELSMAVTRTGFPRLWQGDIVEPFGPPEEGKMEGNAKSLSGFADPKPEPVMSEQVPETRPKPPAVAMKPTVSVNPNLLGYIGIDTIIEQMRRKTMRTGFDFNIMVVDGFYRIVVGDSGQSGLGKSTLVNTLFKSQVSRKSSGWSREEKIPKTVEIKAISHVIEEGGVKMKLTVIDTPGFGDQINNENCWEPIEKFINEQYEKFLKEEVNIARKKRIPDTRVHCCLYFISPTGHSLRPLDLEFMKHLSKVVNIIPVIAKADTMTLEEKTEFKQRVRKELEMNGIEFYPQKEFDEDQEDKSENDKIRQDSMPFAVVGSDKEFQVNGKRVLGRRTPWGVIEVENLAHCEFALLRDFVIRTHLQDLKEVTHNIHYETYRAKRLNDNGGLPPVSDESHESSI